MRIRSFALSFSNRVGILYSRNVFSSSDFVTRNPWTTLHGRRTRMSQSLISRLLAPSRSVFCPSSTSLSPRLIQSQQSPPQSLYKWQSTDAKAQEPEAGAGAEESTDAKGKKKDPAKDRTQVIPVETSIRYLQSKAYKDTYGDLPVWVPYRRNFKGQFAPKKTRKTCIRKGELTTGNACPICRDEYLVLNYKNVELLKQFISPHNGETLGTDKTGLCRVKHFELSLEMEKAKDYGTITYDVPFRDYSNYDYEALALRMAGQSEQQMQARSEQETGGGGGKTNKHNS